MIRTFTRLVTALATLLHDDGKATWLFLLKQERRNADPDLVRHEIVSGYAFLRLVADRPDEQWLHDLAHGNTSKLLDRAMDAGLTELRGAFEKSSSLASDSKRVENKTVAQLAIWWLIVSHHRLLLGNFPGTFNYGNHVNDQAQSQWKKLKQPKGKGLLKIATHPARLVAIRTCASELLALVSSKAFKSLDANVILSGCYTYARPVMILADHAASSHPSYDDAPYPDAKSGQRRISVPQHNLDVYHAAKTGFEGFLDAPVMAPPIKTIPPAILSTDVPDKFAWQSAAIHKIKAASIKPATGFFGVVLAGTGTGKTIGCVKIKTALDPHARFTVALPLRSLTLQTGSAYSEDMGFEKQDIFVKIGSPIISSLYEINRQACTADTAAQQAMDEDILETDGDRDGFRGDPRAPLPVLTGLLKDFVDQAPSQNQHYLTQYLGCPILVATIDSLMGVSAAFRPSRMEHALRLLTSDLIIDEIDSFDARDIAAIARLIYVSGTYGRRVIIASATLPPSIAETCYRAYQAGYQVYCQVHGKIFEMMCGWFPDEASLVRVSSVTSSDHFVQAHTAVTKSIFAHLVARPALRRAAILPVSHCRNHGELFQAVLNGCLSQHARHHIQTDLGKVSMGFVRWSRVDVARDFGRFVSEQPPTNGILHKVICYHSRHMLSIRNKMESFLDQVCNRKGSAPHSRLLADKTVQAALKEAQAKGLDLMIVVICSPILEVGRDYDFDWAIIDPSGLRMLVQALGRLGRHSLLHGCITALILEEPYLALRNRWQGQSSKPAYMHPGVEDKNDDRWRVRDIAGQLISKVNDVFDMTTLSSVVDARDCLVVPDRASNPIGWLEHDRLRHELIDCDDSVCRWFEADFVGRMTNWHQTRYQFRRDNRRVLSVWRGNFDNFKRAWEWRRSFDGFSARPGATTVSDARQGDAFLLNLDSSAIYGDLVRKLDPAGTADHFRELCGFEFNTSRDITSGIEYSDQLGGGMGG